MTKLLIDVPDNLHRYVKTVASSKGESLKKFVLRAMENLANKESGNFNQDFAVIDEETANKALSPYLSSLVKNIDSGEELVLDSESFFDELNKS
jgi:hypothetical protein